MTKTQLWTVYWKINTLKMCPCRVRLGITRARWEKKLRGFLDECSADSPSDSLDDKGTIYLAFIPDTRSVYIGQTGRGAVVRWSTHVRQAATAQSTFFFHLDLRQCGTHRAVWFVLHSWAEVQEKIVRLRREAERDASRHTNTGLMKKLSAALQTYG